jgi:hypothetical protein
MSKEPTVEDRLAILERTMAELQKQLAELKAPVNWLDQVRGSCTDDEAFLEALEYGRQYRQADRPPDDVDTRP